MTDLASDPEGRRPRAGGAPPPLGSGPGPDADPWASATTFADLLRAAGQFMDGTLDDFPGWGGRGLDDESDELEDLLGALVRAGFLPVASQPGAPFGPGHDGRSWGGRAFVGGFAEAALTARLAAACVDLGLLALAVPPAGGARFELPAGLRDGVPYLVLGSDARAAELEIFAEEASPAAAAALAPATFLWLVDPIWGRRERLIQLASHVSFGANEGAARP